jgi:hypothetical protein
MRRLSLTVLLLLLLLLGSGWVLAGAVMLAPLAVAAAAVKQMTMQILRQLMLLLLLLLETPRMQRKMSSWCSGLHLAGQLGAEAALVPVLTCMDHSCKHQMTRSSCSRVLQTVLQGRRGCPRRRRVHAWHLMLGFCVGF